MGVLIDTSVWVDLALLASTLITPGARLWTLDKGLAELAERLVVAYRIRE